MCLNCLLSGCSLRPSCSSLRPLSMLPARASRDPSPSRDCRCLGSASNASSYSVLALVMFDLSACSTDCSSPNRLKQRPKSQNKISKGIGMDRVALLCAADNPQPIRVMHLNAPKGFQCMCALVATQTHSEQLASTSASAALPTYNTKVTTSTPVSFGTLYANVAGLKSCACLHNTVCR